jgi:DNA repair exonuclease SbcCD ATPase subunit
MHRQDAKETARNLDHLAAEHHRLIDAIREAQRQADLHARLDDLLGKEGLQRELVRTAEREIVRLANDTVQNLSDGDLTVELEDEVDGDDQAFALRVRRADGPTPIGVHYLSGSQKFRVAISVALAIGRFAAGQARRLDSVVIDEGFGSLDRDGLRAAADELNRLRQHLRRIIVVSHQEEFAGRFPVRWQLSQGENGTTATAVRQ